MPTYTYYCEQCQQEFEEFHSITAELHECPKCRENGLDSDKPKRLIAGSTFILAGSGWSKTGYSS